MAATATTAPPQPDAGTNRAAAGLPPGPRAPAGIQTARLVLSPIGFFEAGRRRYGDTFTARLLGARKAVFVSDPASLKRLFGADRVNTINRDRNFLLSPVLGPRSILVLEDDEHLRRRRLMLPPFHGERMRAYERVIEEVTEREVSTWRAGRPFPLHPSMQAITLDVILRAVFGVTDGARAERLRADLLAILGATRSPLALGLTIPGLGRLGPYRRLRAALEDADRVLAEQISERRADPRLSEREDILSMLVAARFDDGSAMDDREVRDQLMTLLMAGHETTATALAWAFDLLLHAPAELERLRAELARDGGYLKAVIEETLRLRPVVPFVGRELRAPAELGGFRLPPGTTVMAAIYLAHTRAETYPDPYAFRPERFLDGGPDTYAWIPFGGGTRRCLGAAFAELEMRIVLDRVLTSVELRAASSRPERAVRRNVTLSPRMGTRAVLVARH